jgi:hypothetical protein
VRILSLGAPLPHSQVDNYDWASAPSFFDYDAVVIEPAESVSRLIEGIVKRGESFATFNNEPVLDGMTTDEAVGLADLLRRRREEVQRFLSIGGLLIVYAYPDVPHPGVGGFNGAHRYYWLPAPAGTNYGPDYLQPASGRYVSPIDHEHPFAEFLEYLHDRVNYRATLAEPGFGDAMKVFARSPGGAALAAEVSVAGGRLVFLPAYPTNLTHAERMAIGESMVGAVRNALLGDAEDDPPQWLDDFLLPGLREADQKLRAAETGADDAEAELTEARNAFRRIDVHRRLLWQEGKFGLELPVRDVLVELGFIMLSNIDDPAALLYGDDTVLLEVEGSLGTVGMNPHYRLRQRIERSIEQGKRPKGLVVVNGERAQPPTQRTQAIDDSLRIAAESMRYCVVEAVDLYEALKRKFEGEEGAAEFCRALLATEGVYQPGVTTETAKG